MTENCLGLLNNCYPVRTTIRVDKDWGLKQIEADPSQSGWNVHTTEFILD